MTKFEKEEYLRKKRIRKIIEFVLIIVIFIVTALAVFFAPTPIKGASSVKPESVPVVYAEEPTSSETVSSEDIEWYMAVLKASVDTTDDKLAQMAKDNVQTYVVSDTPEEDALDDQFEELCYVVMCEGGYTEPDEGIHMMAAGVLNRVDSPLFPNTIHEVIYQRGQFESATDLYKYVPTERVIQICAEEMEHRSNTQVLYWRTGHYHAKTRPIAHIGHHYYSGQR